MAEQQPKVMEYMLNVQIIIPKKNRTFIKNFLIFEMFVIFGNDRLILILFFNFFIDSVIYPFR